jgi:Reverse transcriptase (RNA-dependent DNA polymerase)
VKLTKTGEVERFKARLVAKGLKHIYGVNNTEVSAPISSYSTLQLLLSHGVEHTMHAQQMDASTAIMHGNFD